MDFPKTIYVGEIDFPNSEFTLPEFANVHFSDGELVAIYTLKEVKKKVTNIELKELDK